MPTFSRSRFLSDRLKIISSSKKNVTVFGENATTPPRVARISIDESGEYNERHRPTGILSNKIADAIVALAKAKDGPVKFSEVDAEIPGFAKDDPPSKGYAIELRSGAEILIWSGMSEAGYRALRKILAEGRVAIQFVNLLPYMLDDCPNDPDWMPAVLLPAKAANLRTPRWLMRTSEYCRRHSMARAARENNTGYGLLTPSPMRFTADQFFPGGWQH